MVITSHLEFKSSLYWNGIIVELDIDSIKCKCM